MTIRQILTSLTLLLISLTALATNNLPLDKQDVPDALKNWIPWALHGHENKRCPYIYNNADETICAWATTLDVKLRHNGGHFIQQWQVFAPSWLRLPGNIEHWPQNIRLNGKSVTVIQDQDGLPALFANKGKLKIEGDFIWSALPETLTLPGNTGLVSLTLNGKASAFPVIDEQHRLWLSKKTDSEKQNESDQLELQVFRKISDDIPMKIHTHMVLKVTGKQREVTLGPVPVNHFIPMSMHSQLPAQLESSGMLRIQVRPGIWVMDIVTRSAAEMESLLLEKISAPWPKQELWVFEAHNNYRLVDIQNPSIDARQTNLPNHWKTLPTYLMNHGDQLKMITIRRGNPQPEPDQLALTRNLWLDFNGGGYTFQDHIQGTITSGWRLETAPLLDLGRIAINGEPQLITRLSESSKKSGVEVRRGQLQLSADGRIASDQRVLPVAGWDKEFRTIQTSLHLPPGWSVFFASGTDNQPNTFTQRWSLLDLFLVLVISVAVARLWSWPWGVVALVTMTLIWHEPNAPHYTWLNLLIAIALVKVLPANRFALWVRGYRHASLILLVLLLVPFLIQQARVGLHPQLAEHYAQQAGFELFDQTANFSDADEARFDQPVMKREQSVMSPKPDMPERRSKIVGSVADSIGLPTLSKNYNLIDPSANIQTGYGLPSWSWQQIDLSWNGPVVKDQDFRLLLIPPTLNRILNFARIALIISLVLLFIGYAWSGLFSRIRQTHNLIAICFITGFIIASSSFSPPSEAAETLPNENLLKQLRDKLLTPPNCLPHCAQASRLHINASQRSLQIRLEIHSAENTAVPLPGDIKSWHPANVLVDGKPAAALQRDSHGTLWIQLNKGVHQITLQGPIDNIAHFTIALPLLPKLVTQEIKGWRLDGVHQNGRVDSQLQFSRKTVAGDAKDLNFEQSTLPSFVYVERTLRFGIDWSVETQVVRASPSGAAIVLNVPLLDGETVTSDINVQNNQVVVNMSPQQTEFGWHSTLRKSSTLTLRTSDNPDWFEIWRADISPIWHANIKGIAPVSHYDSSRQWLPEWHPWPSESVHLELTRPIGVEGKTFTIDNSQLNVTTSKRASHYQLQINLRSSQGGKHQFIMPIGTELQSVKINNRAMPIRLDQQVLTLPITPGAQLIDIEWRQRDELGHFFQTPVIQLGSDSTNSRTRIQFNRDRWLLFVGGPRLGPAVLFWGVLIVLALISIGLGRYKPIPLKSWHWFLLAIGLTQVSIWWGLVFLSSFFALAYRQQSASRFKPWLFNLMQIGIAMLLVVAAIILIVSIHQGLLGHPDMQIAGNNSSSYYLNWYQDRIDDALPSPWIFSVSLIWYRVLMLLWALWLAMAVIRWSKWAWQCYATGGLWKASRKPMRPPQPTRPSLEDKGGE